MIYHRTRQIHSSIDLRMVGSRNLDQMICLMRAASQDGETGATHESHLRCLRILAPHRASMGKRLIESSTVQVLIRRCYPFTEAFR